MFETFIGQERWQRYFATALMRDHLSHAYVFVGPDHLGKQTFMEELARALMCRALTPEVKACQTCVACLAWRRETHPDLIALLPNEKNTISVEEVRLFIDDISRSASVARHRVAFMPQLGQCTPSAANALLKILEEPPAHTIILACVGESEQLPTTLRSRFQVCRFAPVPVGELAEALSARGSARGHALEVARLAEGHPGLALHWIEHKEEVSAYVARAEQFLRSLEQTMAERFALTETVATEERCTRHELLHLLDEWLTVLRDGYLRAAQVPEYAAHQSLSTNQHAETAAFWSTACRQLLETRRRLDHYANRRLALNSFFLSV